MGDVTLFKHSPLRLLKMIISDIQDLINQTQDLCINGKYLLAEILIDETIEKLISHIELLGLWIDGDVYLHKHPTIPIYIKQYISSEVLNKVFIDLHIVKTQISNLSHTSTSYYTL